MSGRLAGLCVLVFATSLAVAGTAADHGYEQRTEWVMGTALRVLLPTERDDRDVIFAACFAEARRWDALLSPWQAEAPLSRLSAGAGEWVEVPPELLDYLDRAAYDAERSGHIFDITLAWQGSRMIETDREGSRARLPGGAGPLDPGGDGKGAALDAMAVILDRSGVREALVDFGGSSFLARGGGPRGEGWEVALAGSEGELIGVLRLVDTALSVSSGVQRDRREDGTATERFHLRDLRTGEPVRARRTAAVLSASATEAEVLSTVAAIVGTEGLRRPAGERLLDRFRGCALGVFEGTGPEPFLHGGFAAHLRAGE